MIRAFLPSLKPLETSASLDSRDRTDRRKFDLRKEGPVLHLNCGRKPAEADHYSGCREWVNAWSCWLLNFRTFIVFLNESVTRLTLIASPGILTRVYRRALKVELCSDDGLVREVCVVDRSTSATSCTHIAH